MAEKLSENDLRELVNPQTQAQRDLYLEVQQKFQTTEPIRLLYWIEQRDEYPQAVRDALSRKLKSVIRNDSINR